MSQANTNAAAALVVVDIDLWKACAGASVTIPAAADSKVYYFPQGHAERCSSVPNLAPVVYTKPMIPCRVINVRHLINQTTDEVFAAIRLIQVDRAYRPAAPNTPPVVVDDTVEKGIVVGGDRIASFAKILTQSDANNGGGFSVPRYCADSIFPALNYESDPPVQNLTITDLQGVEFRFRHIYRGTPKRHLFTTGWSKFVNAKNLVAGDTVIFMRDGVSGKLYVGIRRAPRWSDLVVNEAGGLALDKEGGWEMRRIPAKVVEEASLAAAQGLPFEVFVYPRGGKPEFVVDASVVEKALSFGWKVGMKVRMVAESEDLGKLTWFHGNVSKVLDPTEPGKLWLCSPWKMLEVLWDEPAHFPNKPELVGPWQVEVIRAQQYVQSICAAPSQRDMNWEPSPWIEDKGDLKMGLPGQSPLKRRLNHPSMQGARLWPLCDVSNIVQGNPGGIKSEAAPPRRDDWATFKRKKSEPTLSNIEAGQPSNDPRANGELRSFQLFGQTIHVKE